MSGMSLLDHLEDREHPVSAATEITAPGFDYTALPSDIRDEAKAAADRIKERMRGAVVDVGAELIRIKDQLPHGQFGQWLSAEFGLTERTAQNYMAAAALAAKYETVSVLRPKTLYLLAAPSTPEPARQDVISRLDRGEAIDDRTVKEIIDDAKFNEQQEKIRAKLARRPASTRRSKAERERRWRAEEEEREKERARREQAQKALVEFLVEQVSDLPQLLTLLREAKEIHLLDKIESRGRGAVWERRP